VPETSDDTGPTISQLWGAAWLLGAAATIAWIFLALELGRRRPWDTPAGSALAVGVVCTVAAAGCAVVLAVKAAEARLRSAPRRS
jgi:hypothetical protein